MRDYGIDAYLSDLNVAIDDLGGRASLIGLCQGGWLAAAYAARFPGKVARLVLAGAPIDVAAAELRITRALARISPAAIESAIAFNGGRVSGPLSLALWSLQGVEVEYTAEIALQCTGDAALEARFNAWNARAVDLPGLYFRQAAEWLFRENRLARGRFPALGRPVRLSDIGSPVFVLAAEADEVVAVPQAVAAKTLCRSAHVDVRIEPGRHLSLFMGRRTLSGAWRDIARWLEGDAGGRSPAPRPAFGGFTAEDRFFGLPPNDLRDARRPGRVTADLGCGGRALRFTRGLGRADADCHPDWIGAGSCGLRVRENHYVPLLSHSSRQGWIPPAIRLPTRSAKGMLEIRAGRRP